MNEIADEKLDTIIRKIKGLLSLSEKNDNDDEAQTAFLMAQKLMIKYNIEMEQMDTTVDKQEEIVKDHVTAFKTILWWENELASIVTQNFRVRLYIDNAYWKNGTKRLKRCITFFGLKSDVMMAKEVYVLAYDVLKFYASRYVEHYYKEHYRSKRFRERTLEIKNSYMKGFLSGLSQKFYQQFQELKEQYGLMVVTPEIVKKEYQEFTKNFIAFDTFIPKFKNEESYKNGYIDGKNVDYRKESVDDDIVT